MAQQKFALLLVLRAVWRQWRAIYVILAIFEPYEKYLVREKKIAVSQLDLCLHRSTNADHVRLQLRLSELLKRPLSRTSAPSGRKISTRTPNFGSRAIGYVENYWYAKLDVLLI